MFVLIKLNEYISTLENTSAYQIVLLASKHPMLKCISTLHHVNIPLSSTIH